MPTAAKEVFRDDQPLVEGTHDGEANLIPDANFENQVTGIESNWDNWVSTVGTPIWGNVGESSGYGLQLDIENETGFYNAVSLSSRIPAVQGETFYAVYRSFLSSDYADSGNNGIYFALAEQDAGGSDVGYPQLKTGVGTTGSWFDKEGTFSITHAETVQVMPIVFIYHNAVSGGAGTAYVDRIYLSRGAAATSLRDDSIDFVKFGVTTGLYCENVTRSTGATIDTVTSHEITATGVEWRMGDTYRIYRTATKNSIISSHWTDVSRGWKISRSDDITNDGWRREDLDLDYPNRRKVFGPGQPEGK